MSKVITDNDLKGVLNKILPYNLTSPVFISEHLLYTSTTANTLVYSGVSVTIPANCFYALEALATYSGAKPNAVTINTNSTNANDNIATGAYAGAMSTCSVINKTDSSPITLYVFVNYATAISSAGNIYIRGFYIPETNLGYSTTFAKSKTTFTPTAGSSYSNYGGCFYEVCGNLVHIHIGVSELTAGTGTSIYTLPTTIRPPSTAFAMGTGGSNASQAIVEIHSDGTVFVSPNGNTYCGADVWYYID